MSNIFKRMVRKNSRITISLVVILALIFVNSVSEASKNAGQKPPNAQDAQVTLEDIQVLNEYVNNNKNAMYIVENPEVLNYIKEETSNNNELQKFTGINKESLTKAFKSAVYSGKIHNNDVYVIMYEYAGKENSKKVVLATYDINRGILIEAMDYDQSQDNDVTVTSRNVGLTFEGTFDEAVAIKNASPEERKELKDKNRKQHNKEISSVSETQNKDNVLVSLFSVETTSANTCSGSLELTGAQCSWVAVGYCAVAGLFGFIPGLICAIGYTYVCNYTC